jgi:hypothetical protein
MARYLITFAALLQLACQNPTAADVQREQARGRLTGLVKIGPNCPVERAGQPCPPPPGAFAARKIVVYDEQHGRLLFTVDIDEQGNYAIDLVAGRYVVDFKGSKLDRSSDVPKLVEILPNATTTLNISIDTGLR